MAISLGGVALPDLIIDGEFEWTGVAAQVDTALSGNPIVWEHALSGRSIDLVGEDDTAWIARSVLVSLQALAAVVNGTYALVYESDNYTVRFRHEDAPAIYAEPIIPRPNQAGTDWYNRVRIKLMVV